MSSSVSTCLRLCNVLSYSLFKTLQIGPLQSTNLIIQLADRSCTKPEGVVIDVFVHVGKLSFLADFYVLRMEDEGAIDTSRVLLGRPFMATARTKIDTYSGDLSMEVDGEVINFNIYKSMKYPNDFAEIHVIDVVDEAIQEMGMDFGNDALEYIISKGMETEEETRDLLLDKDETARIPHSMSNSPRYETQLINSVSVTDEVSSSVQDNKMELKPLPKHLKHVYLGEDETLPVIIKRELESDQEERLVRVLKENKEAIGWSLADIKGISPAVCMHRILLEEGAKPVRQPQRRLNPTMMEVVQKEVQKLLDAGVIYPISDSEWVSPIHVVPKKTGMTVEENDKGELVPKRVQNGWRMCIDYRKLNAATRKDHFPFPFIDQMLDKLSGKSHFCFLDGFSG